jgi:hypothetical protein
MNRREKAMALALSLLQAEGLGHVMVTISGRSKRRMGSCQAIQSGDEWTPVLITLAAWHVDRSPWHLVEDTIRHEVAHAATPGDGHGPAWRTACKRLGAKPDRCHEGELAYTPKPKWIGTCQGCFSTWKRHRLTKAMRNRYHVRCGRVWGNIEWEEVA